VLDRYVALSSANAAISASQRGQRAFRPFRPRADELVFERTKRCSIAAKSNRFGVIPETSRDR